MKKPSIIKELSVPHRQLFCLKNKTTTNTLKTHIGVYKTTTNIFKTRIGVYKTTANKLKTRIGVCKTTTNILKTHIGVYKPTDNILKTRIGVCKTTDNILKTTIGVYKTTENKEKTTYQTSTIGKSTFADRSTSTKSHVCKRAFPFPLFPTAKKRINFPPLKRKNQNLENK